MATVTAVRAAARGRVAVELDGAPWRTLPVEVVARSGLAPGIELDRPAARALRRELRRAEALAIAGRALRTRDLSRRELEERLAGGVAPAAGEQALQTLGRAGLVDDGRMATNRAAALADRGYGDLAIAHDLEQKGIERDHVEAAIAGLAPEIKRAEAIVGRRGRGPATARYLGSKGFGEDAVEAASDRGFATDP